MGIRSFSLLSAAIAALLMLAAPAAADDYPNRPVRIIVPFAPGGINDIAARVIATRQAVHRREQARRRWGRRHRNRRQFAA
jgi:tripartite-type tricarboxylate transporter receptor subunit TctC